MVVLAFPSITCASVVDAENAVIELVNIVKSFSPFIWDIAVISLSIFVGPKILVRLFHIVF